MLRCRNAGLVVALVLLGALAASPASAHVRRTPATRCPRSTETVRLPKHVVACVPRSGLRRIAAMTPATASATSEAVVESAARALARRWKMTRRMAKPLAQLRALMTSPRFADSVAGALGSPAASAARLARRDDAPARARAATAPTEHLTQTDELPQPGEVGVGRTISGSTEHDAGHGSSVSDGGAYGMGGFVQKCPDANGVATGRANGVVGVDLRASDPRAGAAVMKIEIKGDAKLTGHVGDDAELKTVDMVANVSLRASLNLYDQHGKLVQAVGRSEGFVHTVLVGLGPEETHPEFPLGPKVRMITWTGNADPAMAMMGTDVALAQMLLAGDGAYRNGEGNWNGMAACIDGSYDPPQLSLRTGESHDVAVRLTSVMDHGPVSMPLTARPTGHGSLTPAAVTTDGDGRATTTYRAGDHAEQDRVVFEGTSKRGRARVQATQIDVQRPPDGPPYFYKVVSTDFHTHADASQSGTTATCNAHGYAVGGSNDFTGESGPVAFDPANTVAAASATGPLTGKVYATVPAHWHQHLMGCTLDGNNVASPCSTDRDDDASAGWPIGFQLEADSANAVNATLHWSIPGPFVGVGAGGDAVCNVYELRQELDYASTEQQVPMTQLTGRAPFTVTFAGGPLSWAKTNTLRPATISFTWSYSLTLQRVDAQGGPLP